MTGHHVLKANGMIKMYVASEGYCIREYTCQASPGILINKVVMMVLPFFLSSKKRTKCCKFYKMWLSNWLQYNILRGAA